MAWDPWHDPWRPSQLDDPPLAQKAPPADSSDEDSIPPPSYFTGLSRQLDMTMTVNQLAESLFGAAILEPGVLRVLVLAKLFMAGHLSGMQLDRAPHALFPDWRPVPI